MSTTCFPGLQYLHVSVEYLRSLCKAQSTIFYNVQKNSMDRYSLCFCVLEASGEWGVGSETAKIATTAGQQRQQDSRTANKSDRMTGQRDSEVWG